MHRSIRYALFILLFTVPAAAQTTDALWQSLMEGNRVFVAGKLTFDHLAELRHESAGHQNPPVTVLSCADSRVPPELVFNRSIDQLFVVRVAGTSPDRSTSPASSSPSAAATRAHRRPRTRGMRRGAGGARQQ
jgi:hypothetical protein